jgi:hypothetical protein
MAQLNHMQYEALERAVMDGTRVVIRRRGHRDHIIVPLRLVLKNGREVLSARSSTTGRELEIALDDVEHIEVVR